MHFVADPVSSEFPTVCPFIFSVSMDVIVEEVAFVRGSVSPKELTEAILLSKFIVPFILSAIRPLFFSLSMLLVVYPVALVFGTVCMSVLPKAVSVSTLLCCTYGLRPTLLRAMLRRCKEGKDN